MIKVSQPTAKNQLLELSEEDFRAEILKEIQQEIMHLFSIVSIDSFTVT